jgi:hypothetical protein
MPNDHIRYDVLVQAALRGMVRGVLEEIAQRKALPGDHHFFITFDTTAPDVQLSARLRAQYPDKMTVVLQHQFWDLKVTESTFEVGLSFGGVAEKLVVPLAAIQVFQDPSVQFTLQFETVEDVLDETETETGSEQEAETKEQKERKGQGRLAAVPASAAAEPDQNKASDKGGAEVVRLDRFRKK